MTASKRRRTESVTGHLAAIAILSALTWWGLSFTTLPVPVVAWLSGLVAGLSTLRALYAAARTLSAASKPTATSKRR